MTGQQLLIHIKKEMLAREIYYKYLRAPRGIYAAENDKHRYIFIHIPKTGGLSLLYSLFGEKSILGHRNILQYKYADGDKFRDYFKFAVVRNPWNRFASSYFFLLKGGITPTDKKWGMENLAAYPDFESFVLSLKNKRNASRILSWIHFRQQTDFIADSRKNILLDFIGQFEKYVESYTFLKEKFGSDHPLAHINSGSHSGSYEDLFTPEMRQIVGDLYSTDIELLDFYGSPH